MLNPTAGGFSTKNLIAHMSNCQEAIHQLAGEYKKLSSSNKGAEEKLIQERNKATERINREYENKLKQLRQITPETPEVDMIRTEANKQVKNFNSFRETLSLIMGREKVAEIEIPAVLKPLLEWSEVATIQQTQPERMTAARVHQEVANLPMESFRQYKTIEVSIREMFEEISNEAMKPRQIIEYLVKKKHVPQAEASIRTQLHTLKVENKVSYDENHKVYQWNFTEEEKRNLKRVAKSR